MCAFFALPDFPEDFKGKWLDGLEKRYVYLRSRYQNGPNPPALHFAWSDVKDALKDWKTCKLPNQLILLPYLTSIYRHDYDDVLVRFTRPTIM